MTTGWNRGSALFGAQVAWCIAAGLGAPFLASPAVAQTPGETVLYAFQGPATDGENDATGLVVSGNVLYGTTTYGGSGGCSANLNGTPSTVGCGVIFELTLSGGVWTETILYPFTGAADGAFPNTLVEKGGILYGTAASGGNNGDGVVFKLTPPATQGNPWKETVMHSFCKTAGCPDGQYPLDGPIFVGSDLYGTTIYGGSSGFGTVYRLTTAATPKFTSLYSFKGGSSDGAYPSAGVIANKSGTLYGETQSGGGTGCNSGGCGTVYELTPPATAGNPYTETVIYSFSGATEYTPTGRLTLKGADLLGIAGGGAFNYGEVYELAPPKTGTLWTETVLTSFDPGALYGIPGGTYSNGNLIAATNGSIYGTTYGGGDPNLSFGYYFPGTIFELTPPIAKGGAWVQSLLYSFQGGGDGLTPEWGLVSGPDGTLYGTTSVGGGTGCPAQAYNGTNVGCGTVFQFTP